MELGKVVFDFGRCSQVFLEQEINKLILKACLAQTSFGGNSHIFTFKTEFFASGSTDKAVVDENRQKNR